MKLSYNFYIKELNGEYKKTIEKIGLYATIHNIVGKKLDEQMITLIKKMLHAQQNNHPVETVVGMDLEYFCNEQFSDFGHITKLAGLFYVLYRLACIIAPISALFLLPYVGEYDLLFMSQDIYSFTLGTCTCILSFGIVNVCIRPYLFRSEKFTTRTYTSLVLVTLLLLLFAEYYFRIEYTILVPRIAILFVSVMYLILYKGMQFLRS
ncbi:MAG: hypothetical protein Q4G58_02235 [bacterium]|nr:hypothetical protein [bacterium]